MVIRTHNIHIIYSQAPIHALLVVWFVGAQFWGQQYGVPTTDAA